MDHSGTRTVNLVSPLRDPNMSRCRFVSQVELSLFDRLRTMSIPY